MRLRPHRTAVALCLLTRTAVAAADTPMAGKFTDGKLTVDWVASAEGYADTFTLGDQRFPATAHGGANTTDGTFQANGHAFPFTASLDGDTLKIGTGGATYVLKRIVPVNPLAAPANPLGEAAAVADAPPG